MSFLSFIQDLGINPDKRISVENDPNILQGKRFLKYEHMYVDKIKPELKGLQSTGMPGIKSFAETVNNKRSFQGMGYTNKGKYLEQVTSVEKK